MQRADQVGVPARELSSEGFDASSWMKAVVPGTVLTSLVAAGVYPEPYYGTNNKLSEKKIPDISEVGPEFYTYWFRTEFDNPPLSEGERIWLHPEGINYRTEWWLNGQLVAVMAGMFNDCHTDITDFVRTGKKRPGRSCPPSRCSRESHAEELGGHQGKTATAVTGILAGMSHS